MSKAGDLAEKAYPKGDIYIFGDASIACQVAYVKGYHQAEKDLTDISWIKEVSGVKDMSRAKEEALKAYPPQSIAANYDTINRRDAFEYGYLKAEKDLELTWEDMLIIHRCIKYAMNYHLSAFQTIEGQQKVYEDVLKWFKAQKGEEYGKRI